MIIEKHLEGMKSNIKNWYEQTYQSFTNRDSREAWKFISTNLVNIFFVKIINANKSSFFDLNERTIWEQKICLNK